MSRRKRCLGIGQATSSKSEFCIGIQSIQNILVRSFNTGTSLSHLEYFASQVHKYSVAYVAPAKDCYQQENVSMMTLFSIKTKVLKEKLNLIRLLWYTASKNGSY